MPQPNGRVHHEGSGEKAGLESQFHIESAATSTEDYDQFDLLIGMDKANIRSMYRICGGDYDGKIHLLLEYAGRPGDEVADPWYTGDFEATWQDVLAGCQGLLEVFVGIGGAM